MRLALPSLLVLLVLGGCGASGNKAGAPAEQKQTLTFEVPDETDPPASTFADAAARRTDGRIVLRRDPAAPYNSLVPANEVRLARAVETGKVPVAYLPARAFAAQGIAEFEALLYPFAISTSAAARAFAESPLADGVLGSLPHSIVGLALVPNEARRFLTVRPPVSKSSFVGMRIRIVDNPQTAADLSALVATPVEQLDAHQASAELLAGRLEGFETSPSSILTNGYQTKAHYFSAYSPFPKFEAIVVNRTVWDGLSDSEQKSLRDAAQDAVHAAVAQGPAQEQEELVQLCEARAIPTSATASALADLATAMRTSASTLATRAGVRELLAQIAKLPGSGVQPLASPLPTACTNPAASGTGIDRAAAKTLPGVYTVTITRHDWIVWHVINDESQTPITYVTTIRKDGTWYQTQKPNFPDQAPFSGVWRALGDKLVFVMLRAGVHGENTIDAPETVRWSYFDGKLTLKNVIVADTGSRALYASHPWRKLR